MTIRITVRIRESVPDHDPDPEQMLSIQRPQWVQFWWRSESPSGSRSPKSEIWIQWIIHYASRSAMGYSDFIVWRPAISKRTAEPDPLAACSWSVSTLVLVASPSISCCGPPEKLSYKLGVIVCRCLHGQAPRYLADHLITASDVASRLRLRSANRHQLIVPRCRLNTYGRRAFSIAGHTRGVQKVLRLDYIEEWKCYKVNFIFQYNFYWVQRICDIFFWQTVNSTKIEIFCLSLQTASLSILLSG